MNKQEIDLLREQLEILMSERDSLLKVVGAAAVLVANTRAEELPAEAAQAANLLSRFVNNLPEETLKDALEKVHVLPLSTR